MVCYVFAYTTSAKEMLWKCVGDLHFAQSFSDVAQEEDKKEEEAAEVKEEGRRWWQYILPFGGGSAPKSSARNGDGPKTARIFDWVKREGFTGLELSIQSPNLLSLSAERSEEARKLQLVTGPSEIGFLDFVKEGRRREKEEALPRGAASEEEEEEGSLWTSLPVHAVRFHPASELSEKEVTFHLDNESVDLNGSFEVSLLTDQGRTGSSK